MKVAVIGLGAMGEGMARNLATAGFEVTGFDVNTEAMQRLKGCGIELADSAAAAAVQTEIIFVVVFRAEQVEPLLFGDSTILDSVANGAVIVMNTTVSPDAARSMSTRLHELGFHYVDAPVTGGKKGADEASMTIIGAAPETVFKRVESAFAAISGRVYAVGHEAGAASTVKMINQMLCGIHVAASCEALAFATRAGANPKAVYEVITHGAGNSLAFETRAPNVFAGDFQPRGVIEIFTKDLGIVADVARNLNFPLPLMSSALQQYLATAARGYARDDDASVVKLYEELSGVSVAKAYDEGEDVVCTEFEAKK